MLFKKQILENFHNKFVLLAAVLCCFLFANCYGQQTRNRYYARDFAYTYWNDGENLNGYDRIYQSNSDIDFFSWGQETTDTLKFCWRWVQAADGQNYKALTMEEGDPDLPTDGNTRTIRRAVAPYQLRNDLATTGIGVDTSFFKPILLHINQSTFELSKPQESGHNAILVGLRKFQTPRTRPFISLDIAPSDLVGTHNYLNSITDSTLFRARDVVLNGISIWFLTLETCHWWYGCR